MGMICSSNKVYGDFLKRVLQNHQNIVPTELIQEINSFQPSIFAQDDAKFIFPQGTSQQTKIDQAVIIKLNDYVYIGPISQTKPLGNGKIILYNQDVYQGKFISGSAHGQGTFNSTNYQFKGIWHQGKPQKGVLVAAEQSYIINSIVIEDKKGQIEIILPNGNKYQGTFKECDNNYYFEGYGKMWFPNGNFYEGSWKKSQMSGWGTFKWSNLQSYEGNFKEGKRNGYGIYYSVDKSISLNCQWQNGIPKNGQAQQTISNKANRVQVTAAQNRPKIVATTTSQYLQLE